MISRQRQTYYNRIDTFLINLLLDCEYLIYNLLIEIYFSAYIYSYLFCLSLCKLQGFVETKFLTLIKNINFLILLIKSLFKKETKSVQTQTPYLTNDDLQIYLKLANCFTIDETKMSNDEGNFLFNKKIVKRILKKNN